MITRSRRDEGFMFRFCANVLYGCSPFSRGCNGFLKYAVGAWWLCVITVHWKNVVEQELVLALQNSAITLKEFWISGKRQWSLSWPADSLKRSCRVSGYCPEQPWLPDWPSFPNFSLQLCLCSDISFNAHGIYFHIINNYEYMDIYKHIFHIIIVIIYSIIYIYLTFLFLNWVHVSIGFYIIFISRSFFFSFFRSPFFLLKMY